MPVTSGKQWREKRAEGVEITLPSGHVARIRPVSMRAFLNLPTIPDTLTPIVRKAVFGDSADKLNPEDNEKLHDVLDHLCRYAFVSPRIVDDPQADDEIGIEDLDTTDKWAVYAMLDKAAHEMRSFRFEQARAVESVPESAVGREDAE